MKIIKTIVLLIIITLAIIGCETIGNSKQYFDICMQDEVCKHQVETYGNVAEATVNMATTDIPTSSHPIALIIGSVVTYVVGVIQGKVLCKKKVV